MKFPDSLIPILLVIVSVYFGVSRILLMQQEVTQFFAAGFSHIALISYGFIQLIGAMLLVIPVTRPLGALIVAVCFGISALVFLPSGKIMAPLFSMIGVILAGYVAKLSFTNPGKN